MCELLIALNPDNYAHADPVKSLRGVCTKGDLVLVQDDGWTWGGDEGLPKFVVIKIPGITKDIAQQYMKTWVRKLDYTVVASTPAQDGFRIKVFSSEFSVSGKGKVAVDMITDFISDWNLSVFNFGDNFITFDFTILNLIKRPVFWDIDLTGLTVQETGYVQATGVHTLSLNIAGSSLVSAQVQQLINQFGSVISVAGKTITFSIARSSVLDRFKQNAHERFDKYFCKRRYYLDKAFIDTVIAGGGVATLALADFNTNLKDKILD